MPHAACCLPFWPFSGDNMRAGTLTLPQKRAPDPVLVVLLAVMLFCGALMSYSAGGVYALRFYGDAFYFLRRYVVFALLSVALTLPFVLFATPAFWRRFAVFLYAAALLLLVLVLLIGTVGGGARRWLVLGPLTLQPSEVAKTALILILALVMTRYGTHIASQKRGGGSFRYGVLLPGALFLAVGLLVAAEKHISGLLIIGMISVAMLLLGGTRLRYLGILAAAVAAVGFLLVLVSSYAQVRVDTWLHIEEVDPLGSAWQTLQGLYAIGSGGFFGRGFLGSRQKFGYVSQPQNDFIFTVICEEFGFLGAALLLLLFALLVWRCFYIAARTRDRFAALVVYGIGVKLALQTLLNVAVVTNSMPNTGVSLPFFSSGGTFLAIQIFEMGIVLSISRASEGSV